MDYAKSVVSGFNGELTPIKKKLIYEMLYKRPSAVAKWWTKDIATRFINATDDEAVEMAKEMHKRFFTETYKGRNRALDRIFKTE